MTLSNTKYPLMDGIGCLVCHGVMQVYYTQGWQKIFWDLILLRLGGGGSSELHIVSVLCGAAPPRLLLLLALSMPGGRMCFITEGRISLACMESTQLKWKILGPIKLWASRGTCILLCILWQVSISQMLSSYDAPESGSPPRASPVGRPTSALQLQKGK